MNRLGSSFAFMATPHNCVGGTLQKFWAINSLRFLEIHKVFLQKRAFF